MAWKKCDGDMIMGLDFDRRIFWLDFSGGVGRSEIT